MIFVTVGTHEAPFDRLVKAADQLGSLLSEEVFVQRGYSRVSAPHCRIADHLSPDEVRDAVRSARIVISHAGPATLRLVWESERIPIVVPRRRRYGEHVDDHQLAFARRMASAVHLVEDPAELEGAIGHHGEIERERIAGRPRFDPPDVVAARFGDVVARVLERPRGEPSAIRDTLALVKGVIRTCL